jgi:hypothetical protein
MDRLVDTSCIIIVKSWRNKKENRENGGDPKTQVEGIKNVITSSSASVDWSCSAAVVCPKWREDMDSQPTWWENQIEKINKNKILNEQAALVRGGKYSANGRCILA